MHQTIVHFTTLWSFLVDILKGTICIFLQAWLNNIYIFSICHSLLNKCWALLEITVVNIDAILKYENCIHQCSYSMLMILVVLLHCTLKYYNHCNTYSIFSGNFNGLHAGGPNCLLGGASPHLIGGDGPGQPPPLSKPSLKASSSK